MKKMMKCLVLAIMVLTVAGTAWSWDFADHVKVAPGGQGDFLFYPYYLALPGGWETKIWVVNTSPNRSVIAHIGFYSARTSREMLDFFIFLTPTDVWSGIIRYNSTTNSVELYSEDDSAMTGAGVFASATNPIVRAFVNPVGSTCTQGNPEPLGDKLGYVKIVEQAHTDAAASTVYPYPRNAGAGVTVNLNSPPVNKLALYEAFNDFLTAAGISAPTGNPRINPLVMDGLNVLTGYLEFRNTTTGQDATVNATVLRDYDNQTPTGYGDSFGFYLNCAGFQGNTPPAYPGFPGISVGCQGGGGPALGGRVVCPPTLTAGSACGCTAAGLGCQTNSLGEVEAALAKDWVSMPYNSKTSTLHFLTFPTKQTTRNGQDCYYAASPSPFFNELLPNGAARVTQPPGSALVAGPRPTTYSSVWDAWGCFSYKGLNFNTSENSSSVTSIFSPSVTSYSLCGEVNYATGFAFDEGWAVYNFSPTAIATNNVGSYTTQFDFQANITVGGADAYYSGAPVIGTVLYFGSNGLTTLPASYADGHIWYAGANGTLEPGADTSYYYYQYWDAANMGSNGFAASALWYDADEIGCLAGNTAACGTFASLFNATNPAIGAGAAGVNNVYANKFSGNRNVILANVTTTPQKAMNVFVPAGTTITLTAAANFAAVRAPYAAIAGVVGANVVANDTMVTIPALTTITSTADLTDIANMPQ